MVTFSEVLLLCGFFFFVVSPPPPIFVVRLFLRCKNVRFENVHTVFCASLVFLPVGEIVQLSVLLSNVRSVLVHVHTCAHQSICASQKQNSLSVVCCAMLKTNFSFVLNIFSDFALWNKRSEQPMKMQHPATDTKVRKKISSSFQNYSWF